MIINLLLLNYILLIVFVSIIRYLIFFDDGYAQYVVHRDIRVVIESSVYPWEDVASDSRDFIKEYLQTYPERPMVRLQKYNYVKTEWNGELFAKNCL